MANELYRTYEVLIEETVPPDHEKRKKSKKDSLWNAKIDGALRDTHMIFQDAVCYYTLLLAGLAGNEKDLSGKPLNPLWAHLTEGLKDQTARIIRRLTAYYKLPNEIKSPEDFLEKIYIWPENERDKKEVLKLIPKVYCLLEKFGVNKDREVDTPKKLKDMANFSSDNIRRLCASDTGQADSAQRDRNENYFAELKAQLKSENGISIDDGTISSGIKLEYCFMTSKRELSGEEALRDFLAAFGCETGGKRPTTIGQIEGDLLLARNQLVEVWGEFPKPKENATQEEKRKIKEKQEAWRKKADRFPLKSWAGNKPNKRFWYCLRYKWVKNELARNDLYELIKSCKPKNVKKGQIDEITQWRKLLPSSREPFPFFTRQLGSNDLSHFDFDKAAFASAAEDVFKYKIRTLEREKKVQKLWSVVKAYEASGESTLDADDSPAGKKLTIRGMKDDPRWKGEHTNGNKGIVELLTEMKSDKDSDEYGLRKGTISGWAELSKNFKKVYKKAKKENKSESEICKLLEDAVDDEQTANRQGFGSADFFHKLCEPAYHHLWLPEHEHNSIKDFIPAYVSYAEWKEELRDLSLENDEPEDNNEEFPTDTLKVKPINYTWPGLLNRHKKPSYRYYDFNAKLNKTLTIKKLFCRIMDGDRCSYVLFKDQTVKLSARRLKRDKIMDGKGESVDALWCPPLILEGEVNPSTEKKPRAGKSKKNKKNNDIEASFSLMVAPLPGDNWNEITGVPTSEKIQPVHFTVSIPIDGNELKKLEKEGVYFAGGSLKGIDENDEKRRYFRWPIDIETDKVAAKEVENKNSAKSGDKSKKGQRRKDIKPDDLWCHFDAGFRVKESRYSKTSEIKAVPDFHILSIDLGNRFAAAFTRLRIHADKNGNGRVISASDSGPAIKAEVTRTGTLRLQGEDAKIWQRLKDAKGNYIYEFKNEPFGNGGRGRFPNGDEYKVFKKLACRLVPEKSLSLEGTDKITYAELGDLLVFRLKRRIGRLRTLFNLIWRLCGDKEKDKKGRYTIDRTPELLSFHRRMVVETLARSAFPRRERKPGEEEDKDDKSLRLMLASEDQWKKLKDDKLFEKMKGEEEKKRQGKLEEAIKNTQVWKWKDLSDAIKKQIKEYCESDDALDKLLIETIEFCLPLRGRHWGWNRSREDRLHWENKDEEHKPNIRGMRGLSLKRLDQILNLRQRCQSFAKLEDRNHNKFLKNNFNPPDSVPREEVPDVCSLLLERSNRLRKQRVNQAAHMILAEALGMELKNPGSVVNKKERRYEVDLHGEYQRRKDKNGKDYPHCAVIVLENLERYKTSQERTRAENSRLMKWAHRAIVEKLEDMCKPFGITIMLVDPAFSSRFDSRTGLPGVRVNSVSRGFEKEMPYTAWVNQKNKKGKPTRLAEDIIKVAKMFDDNPKYEGQLIIAVEGGKEFLSVNGTIKDKINSDINAAANVGFRAVTNPCRWDVFPLLRTKQLTDDEVEVLNWRSVFDACMNPDDRKLVAVRSGTRVQKSISSSSDPNRQRKNQTDKDSDDSGTESSEYPRFFVQAVDFSGMEQIEYFKPCSNTVPTFKAYPQGVFLKRVEQICNNRIDKINKDLLQK